MQSPTHDIVDHISDEEYPSRETDPFDCQELKLAEIWAELYNSQSSLNIDFWMNHLVYMRKKTKALAIARHIP